MIHSNIIVNVADRGSSYSRQIVAGFTMLHMENVEFHEKPELKKRTNHLFEILAGGKRIVCDLSDGYNNFASFSQMDTLLDDVDIFFKACSRTEYNEHLRNRSKVFVLPPRYAATIAGSWNEKIDFRLSRGSNLAKDLLWRIPYTRHAISDYYFNRLECLPNITNREPKVFFYTRLWNPAIASPASSQNEDIDGKTVEARIETKRAEYAQLSKLRAELVCALKREFGSRFVGGIAPDSYTVRTYPDLLGPNLSQRRSYTKAVHSTEICVNTWGTHKCWNFSFGEELAASRAIVTQEAFYDVPPHLKEGQNYLSYQDIEGCLQSVAALLDDKPAIEQMMANNRDYYLNHLRPDQYVLEMLRTAGII